MILNSLVMVVGCALIWGILFLTHPEAIALNTPDVTLGAIGYFKTSLEFAIIVGRLLVTYKDFKSISVAFTSIGNLCGTVLVLLIFLISNDLPWLKVVLVMIGSFVLIKMALESFSHIHLPTYGGEWLKSFVRWFKKSGMKLPFTGHEDETDTKGNNSELKLTFFAIALNSFMQPFLLGLDDMAVYFSLLTVANTFSICIAIVVSHWLLTSVMLKGSSFVIKVVSDPLFVILGILLFLGLGLHGFFEAGESVLHLLHHN
jgi:hypothetical protein